jgi:integrase
MRKNDPHVLAMLSHPFYKPTREWNRANLHCYADFREWLKQTYTGRTMVSRYVAAARWVFCLIDKPYWQLDLDKDIATVHDYFTTHVKTAYTPFYKVGLTRFADFLRLKQGLQRPARVLNWRYYLGELPDEITADIRAYIAQRQTQWLPANCHERTLDTLATLARPLRMMHAQEPLSGWADVTPKRWWRYTEMRLASGTSTTTLNAEMHLIHGCLHFVQDALRDIDSKFLRVEPFKPRLRVPRDAPLDAIRKLLQAIEAHTRRQPINLERLGKLDRVWVLLMLHCGMRSSEVRNLQLAEIDWARRFIRIEQSKGLKDRLLPMSDALLSAIRAYLPVRGPADTLPPDLLVFQHKKLSRSFFKCRLLFYEKQIGAHLTAHQLRHTCATLLLNAGMPVTTVKLILGHMQINTTLGYARVYDGTLAADYHRAMLSIDGTLTLAGTLTPPATLSPAHIAALLDSLKSSGTLNPTQLDVLASARASALALAS